MLILDKVYQNIQRTNGDLTTMKRLDDEKIRTY